MTTKKPVFIAVLGTQSFEFVAMGRTEPEARAAMRAAWDEHRKQTNAGPWADWRDAVHVHQLRAGEAVRDGSPLSSLYG